MRRALSFLIKFALSAVLLYLALNWVNVGTVARRLSDIDLRWIAAALLTILVQNFLLSRRWQMIIGRCGADLSLSQVFRFTMVGLFFNQTLPSSVGGDAMRIWLAGKETNWRIASYSVIVDRAIGVVVLALLVTLCLPWTLDLVHNPVGRAALLSIGFGFIAGGVVFVSLAWNRLSFLQRWATTRHLAATAAVAAGIIRSPPVAMRVFALSFAIHSLTALVAVCAARSIGAELSLLYAFFLVLPVILIAVVPISISGWGIRENAMIAAFGYVGLSPNDGLLVSLLQGASYLVAGVIGGLIWAFMSKPLDRSVASLADGSG